MRTALTIAGAIGIFVLMSFIVEGGRSTLSANILQQSDYSKPAVSK